jgi:signal peptidase
MKKSFLEIVRWLKKNAPFLLMVLIGCMFSLHFFKDYTVLLVSTGSMAPKIPSGSIIVVKGGEQGSLGQIITYEHKSNTLITHRIIRIEKIGTAPVFYTEGDANDYEDLIPLDHADVLGRVVFTFPYFGYVTSILVSPIFLLFFFYVPIGYRLGIIMKRFVNQAST